jgi:C1q domain
MKIKTVTLDVRLSESTKRAIRWGLLPLAVLAGSMAVAHATYTTTWIATGQPVSANSLKTDLDDIQNRLIALEGQAHPASAFHAWATMSQQTPNASTVTVVFDHVEFDLGSEYNSTTGGFTAKNAGYYLVQCQVIWTNNAGSDNVVILKNGVEIGAQGGVFPVTGLEFPEPEITNLVHVLAGDTLTCGVSQYSGSPQSLFLGDPQRVTFSAARLY